VKVGEYDRRRRVLAKGGDEMRMKRIKRMGGEGIARKKLRRADLARGRQVQFIHLR
jgi:hypothetical protein